MTESIENLRKDYKMDELRMADVSDTPFKQFDVWFKEAQSTDTIEPNAMTLSTCDGQGRISSRIVLLKLYGEEGFTFFTNYNSRKGQDLTTNPNASLLFYWPKLERQVRIEGKAEKVSEETSDNYFNSRPENSRIGAWASPQSEIIPSRRYLENLENDYKNIFKEKQLIRPKHWGGFRIVPVYFEFWQGRTSRLHDRIIFEKEGNLWKIHRLAP